MQLKNLIKKHSQFNNVSPQIVLQNYMMERFLERVSLSKYQNNFIIKGGFLISSMVGISARSTMDIDATIKRYSLNENSIKEMIDDILNVYLDDGVSFEVKNIGEIREDDEYNGYRVTLMSHYQTIKVMIKIDITTGDKITPNEIQYEHYLMFEERCIKLKAYNLVTILAEKIETIITRSEQNTRMRDFYDIYYLQKLYSDKIEPNILKKALLLTCERRSSAHLIENYMEVIKILKNSEVMLRQWKNYQKLFDYAMIISFNDICDLIMDILTELFDGI